MDIKTREGPRREKGLGKTGRDFILVLVVLTLALICLRHLFLQRQEPPPLPAAWGTAGADKVWLDSAKSQDSLDAGRPVADPGMEFAEKIPPLRGSRIESRTSLMPAPAPPAESPAEEPPAAASGEGPRRERKAAHLIPMRESLMNAGSASRDGTIFYKPPAPPKAESSADEAPAESSEGPSKADEPQRRFRRVNR